MSKKMGCKTEVCSQYRHI